jgi:hypothetical protein
MKKIMIFFFVLASFLLHAWDARAAEPLSERVRGRILLQVESYGRAWYVNPVDKKRYYLKDGEAAFELMRTLGLGITDADLAKIPTRVGETADRTLVARVAGRIVLQVQRRGEAWYVNPVDGLRYYLADGDAAYALMKQFGLGIKDADLGKISMNDIQVVQDTAFDDVAYVKLSGGTVIAQKNKDQILPPASMTKLMTALVLLDRGIDWNAAVTITPAILAYPTQLVGDDTTSEIKLEAGDIVRTRDLWVAMIVASSNQAAIALVDASGMTRQSFVAAMNAKAKAMSLTRTRFYEPAGLDAHNVTTPYEMALIAEEAFGRMDILKAVQEEHYVIAMQQAPYRIVTVTDRNTTLKPYGVDAAKVGYLIEAQRCVAIKKGDEIVVVMHARSMRERNAVLDLLVRKKLVCVPAEIKV